MIRSSLNKSIELIENSIESEDLFVLFKDNSIILFDNVNQKVIPIKQFDKYRQKRQKNLGDPHMLLM